MTGRPATLRLARFLIRRARRPLPGSARQGRYQEWAAELPAILDDPQIRSGTRRAVRTLRFAAGQRRAAHRLARHDGGYRCRPDLALAGGPGTGPRASIQASAAPAEVRPQRCGRSRCSSTGWLAGAARGQCTDLIIVGRYTDREHELAYRPGAVGGFLTLATVVSVTQPIQTYGYWAVFLAVGLESLGVPIPGETTLIAAALYAGSTHRLNFVTLGIVAAVAAIVGDNLGYLIGRTGGYRLLRRYGHYVRVDEAKLKVGRYLFDRHGGKVVFIGRFISVLRTYAAFLAGVNMMHWRRFLLYNAAGGILWAAVVTASAYLLGTAVHRVSTAITIAGAVLLVVVLAVLLYYMRRHLKRLEALAEQAYPGSLDDYKVPSGSR